MKEICGYAFVLAFDYILLQVDVGKLAFSSKSL